MLLCWLRKYTEALGKWAADVRPQPCTGTEREPCLGERLIKIVQIMSLMENLMIQVHFLFFRYMYITTWPCKGRHAFRCKKKQKKTDFSLSERQCVSHFLSFLSTSAVAVQHCHRSDWNHFGSDETKSLSWILYGTHGSGRQTESSRYELCSHGNCFQLGFIYLSFLVLSVSRCGGRKGEWHLQAHVEAPSSLLFLLEGCGPVMLA